MFTTIQKTLMKSAVDFPFLVTKLKDGMGKVICVNVMTALQFWKGKSYLSIP